MYNSFIYYIIHITYIMHACDVYMCTYICTYITYMVYADTKISIIDNTLKDKKLYLWKNQTQILLESTHFMFMFYISQDSVLLFHSTHTKKQKEKKFIQL